MHLIAIRMFVESILRYGLPPAYQAAVLIPADKAEPRLRTALNSAFGGGEARRGHTPLGPTCVMIVNWVPSHESNTLSCDHVMHFSAPLHTTAGKGDMWTDAEGIGGTFAGLAGDSEMYAYVSFAINMESS